MREYNCDILIIGAGFAGDILGFLLRKSGKDVLMLELWDVKDMHDIPGAGHGFKGDERRDCYRKDMRIRGSRIYGTVYRKAGE